MPNRRPRQLCIRDWDYVYLGRGMTRIDAPLRALAVTAAGYLPVILIAAVVFYLAASWRIRHE